MSVQSHTGNHFPFLRDLALAGPHSYSFLSRDWGDVEQWRVSARAKVHELLAYDPPAVVRATELLSKQREDGYTLEHLRYQVAPGRHTEAFLLIPDGTDKPRPAVMALHDHGGNYFFGKEKITETNTDSQVLRNHISRSYGGRAFASELARRGYVVLVPDAFYFGSQRIDIHQVCEAPETPAELLRKMKKLPVDSDEMARTYNRFAALQEGIFAKVILTAGTTWPGILFHGDRASVDVLVRRAEVDADRIACMGLSIGGYRSVNLFGLDPRIRVGVVAGFMCAQAALLQDHLWWHTWMIYVPRLYRYLDLPDVAALSAPRPLLVCNCAKDSLFTPDGMKAAATKLEAIYRKMGAPDRFRCNLYDEPHSLKVPAQEDAFAWLERWL
jgi:dienelactone hydrolase